MKTVIEKLKKHWIQVWLITVVVLASSFIAFGAYTGLNSVKRVVTTQASPGDLFSSNCMRSSLANKRINSTTYSVTVSNFEQKNRMVSNPEDITYDLRAELRVLYNNQYKSMTEMLNSLGADNATYLYYKNLLDDREYYIEKTDDDTDGTISSTTKHYLTSSDPSYTFTSETLTRGEPHTDRFKVTFDDKELTDTDPEFYIYVTAENVTPNYGPIECLMSAAESTDEVAAWQGSFAETSISTTDYDFYNYIISGSGIGTVDIMWDGNWFDINPFFTDSRSGNVVTSVTTIEDSTSLYNGWQKVQLTVNSTQKNRYELQLYKVKSDTSYTGENAATRFITCKFTAAE